jgi:hypothetical protein
MTSRNWNRFAGACFLGPVPLSLHDALCVSPRIRPVSCMEDCRRERTRYCQHARAQLIETDASMTTGLPFLKVASRGLQQEV